MDILEKEGVNDQVLFDAICAHNPASGVKPQTKLQRAVYAADPMSGFCNAIALCYPDKKIATLDLNVNGDYVDLNYTFENDVPFERIRRITGYLVGTLDRFNDGKRAEERDRVKHDVLV